MQNNKQSKATEDGLFTLQGLIRCGLCGCSYRTDRFHGYRFYACRGQLKSVHIDGSPRCQNRNIRAEFLEQAVQVHVDGVGRKLEVFGNLHLVEIIKDALDNLQFTLRDIQCAGNLMPSMVAEE